jgi:hypothetical protein
MPVYNTDVSAPRLVAGSQIEIAGTNISATAAELNKLSGASVSAAEMDQRALSFSVTLGTSAAAYLVLPWACDVLGIHTVINEALTSADETLTFKDASGTGMTSGVVTITQAASAGGNVNSATPTGNNSFTAGQKLQVAIGGENGTAVTCRITVLLDITG